MNHETEGEAENTLYLVRLREAFRFDFSDAEAEGLQIYSNKMQAVLKTRQAAQAFVKSHAPITENPFIVGGGWNFQIEGDAIKMGHVDTSDDGYDDGGYIEKTTGTDENGDEIYEMEEADFTETSFEDFASLCTAIGVVPPVLPAYDFSAFLNQERTRQAQVEKLLPQWWEDQKESMTNEQKAAIWRTLHPRPYEIVPVPLER